jgi:Na+/phosphate symporter
MKKNISNADRLVRLLIAAVIAVLYFTNVITGTLGLVLLVLGGIFLATSMISFCPIYAIFGISSSSTK